MNPMDRKRVRELSDDRAQTRAQRTTTLSVRLITVLEKRVALRIRRRELGAREESESDAVEELHVHDVSLVLQSGKRPWEMRVRRGKLMRFGFGSFFTQLENCKRFAFSEEKSPN